jgi:hypothetical protein
MSCTPAGLCGHGLRKQLAKQSVRHEGHWRSRWCCVSIMRRWRAEGERERLTNRLKTQLGDTRRVNSAHGVRRSWVCT